MVGLVGKTELPILLAAGTVKVPTQVRGKKIKGGEAVVLMCRELYHMALPAEIEVHRIVVEGQTVYHKASKADPNAMVKIAQVAGAAIVGALGNSNWSYASQPEVLLPEPRHWKKGVPKRIHQARTCQALGLTYEARGTRDEGYCVPEIPKKHSAYEFCGALKATHWKHAMDGVGLALWGSSTTYEEWQAMVSRLKAKKRGVSLKDRLSRS